MNEAHRMQQLNAKMATIERRIDHLTRQLENNECSPGARSFIAAERAALDAALIALRLYHAQAEGLDTPIKVLSELLDLLEERGENDPQLTALLERASVAVTEFASLEAGRKGTDGTIRSG